VPSQDAPHLRPTALIVAGPTASGKSSAALRLAEVLGGEVINADSMQVYSGLRVLTARPSTADEKRAPHHLYGHVEGEVRYSAGRFVGEASAAVHEVLRRGHVPVLCGGTGLYLKALTEGLSPIPEVPTPVQQEVERRWRDDPAALRAELLARDPEMARLEPADRQRHLRAMGVVLATGRPLSDWQREPKKPPLPEITFRAAKLVPDREDLYRRCDARFDHMLEEGALEEVGVLLRRGLGPSLPTMKALGVPELMAHLRGELSLEEARALAQRETRRFAKRQTTWFSNQTDWPAYRTPDEVIEALGG
jgi:tRNA dimethylallyltransferase